MEASEGFPPIARADARVLVLGSLPGVRSLSEQQYYAHPQNAFWRIMDDVFGVSGSYDRRCAGLLQQNIAVWDVLRSSERPGSLDADIRQETAAPNDFGEFFDTHPDIELIVFNGRKAEQMFCRLVAGVGRYQHRRVGLPSTSPAYAAMPYQGKLKLWNAALDFLLPE